MAKITRLIWLWVVLTLIAAFAVTTTPAADRPPKLVGTWLVYLDHLPEVPPLLFTFNADYTFVASAPATWAGNAHGVWKRVGVRTYESTHLSYVFDEEGNVMFLQKSNARYIVSRDGQACTIAAEVSNLLPAGPRARANTETDTGYRLNYEPYGRDGNPAPLPGLGR